MPRGKTTAHDFWKNVDIKAASECWNWKLHLFPSGYGEASMGHKPWRAHRLAWFFTHGDIPEDLYVLHHCDNRACCNPMHLYLGTPSDNMRDKTDRGRCNTKRGSLRKDAILNEQQVRDIKVAAQGRKRGFNREIAQKYGVHPTTISAIINNRNWRQVCEEEKDPTQISISV